MVEVGDTVRTPTIVERGSADVVLGSLFQTQYEPLVGLARLLLDDRGQAEDVVQEAFARTYASWARVRKHDDPLPYLRTAVVNLARGGLRRRRTVRRTRLVPVGDSLSAESTAVEHERTRELAAAVRTLPRRQRECVVLHYYLDAPIAEVAETLDISSGAVKQHLHRALAALGIALRDDEEDR